MLSWQQASERPAGTTSSVTMFSAVTTTEVEIEFAISDVGTSIGLQGRSKYIV
jgi:hypothetical protein